MITGHHDCIGAWRVSDRDQLIYINEIFDIVKDRNTIIIPHDEIAWWYMDDPLKKVDERYYQVDIMYPGIVAEGVKNPYGKKYRMIDGSHRMAKMKLETKYNASFFYVITKEEFYKYLKEV